MCEELDKALQEGNAEALAMAAHLRGMGAAACTIPVECEGAKYLVSVEEVGKPKLGMYGERESLAVGKYSICFFDGTPENGIWLELVNGEGFQLHGKALEDSLSDMFKKF